MITILSANISQIASENCTVDLIITTEKNKKLKVHTLNNGIIILFLLLCFNAKSQIKTAKEIKRSIVSEKQIGEMPNWKKMTEENPTLKKNGNLFVSSCLFNNDFSKIKAIGIVSNGKEFDNYIDQNCNSSVKIKFVEKKDTLKNHIKYELPECIRTSTGFNVSNGNICDYRTYAERHPQPYQQQNQGFLGLLSEIIYKKTTMYPIIDGVVQNKYSVVGPFVVSPDMNHLAYLGIGDGDVIYEEGTNLVFSDTVKAAVCYDGIIGKQYVYIKFSSLHFSSDSKHFVYAAQLQNNKWIVVYDGKELEEYDNISELAFSPNSEHFAYAALKDNKWCVIYDGKKSKEYDNITGLTFSPNNEHFVYCASMNKDKVMVVVDSKESEEYKSAGWINFSPDGKHLAYYAYNLKNGFFVIDGKAQNMDRYSDIYPGTFNFSIDGNKISYCARKGTKWLMVIDGNDQMENAGVPCASYFSTDCKNVYYIGVKSFNSLYYKNNQVLGKIPALPTTNIHFADNGLLYAYIWDNRVFVNGNKGENYDRIYKLDFISNNEIFYITEKDGKINYVIEKIE